MLVAAPTRGGKGLLATSQLLTWPGSVVVNDIKGELFEQTAGYRASLGKVFVIDPRGVGHRYDPLHARSTEDDLRSSASQLLHEPNEGEGAVFTKRATRMLTQLFRAARLEGVTPLPYVAHLVNSGVIEAAARLNAVSEGAGLAPEKNLATRFLDARFAEANFSDRFLQSAWSTLTSKIDPVITETVIRSVSASDFTASELMCGQRPVTVYLRWPELHLLALTPLIRLVWSSLIDELTATYDREPDRAKCRPLLMLLDEAARTPIPALPEYSATVAGRGITLWIAIQSLSQLDAIYGVKRAETLRDNIDSQIFYRPANLGTANHLEERLGQRPEWAQSQTTHEGKHTSEGQSERSIPLLSAWEIQRLADEDILGFHRDLPPFQAKRIDWRDFRHLRERTKMPPPLLKRLVELSPVLPIDAAGPAAFPECIDLDERN
jgi:type IV secretion system protein VirD4